MKRLIFLILLIPLLCFGAVDTKNGTAITTGTTFDGETGFDTIIGQTITSTACADSSCTGFLICQNFEGTGLDNSETYGDYGDAGTVDWVIDSNAPGCVGCVADLDYATGPGRGSQSFRINNGTEGSFNLVDMNFGGRSAPSEIYIHFMIKLVTAPDIEYADCMSLWEDTITDNMTILINSSGQLYIGCNVGAESSSATGALTPGTWYHVWAYFKSGAGNDAIGWLKLSTDTTEPGSATISKSDFNYTDVFDLIGFTTSSASSEYEYIIDQVLYSSSSIGNVCD